MNFFDVVTKKKRLSERIVYLREVLKTTNNPEEVVNKLERAIDDYRNILVQIDSINHDKNATIEINGNEMSLATAIIIRNSIMSKISILKDAIDNDKSGLIDRIKFIDMIDKEYESLDLLKQHIMLLEFSLEV